jgi:hypothetical protein
MSLLEYEYELEHEDGLARVLGSVARSPARAGAVGAAAANLALRSGMRQVGHAGVEREHEEEAEYEAFQMFPGQRAVNPIRRVYPDAMMEHYGHAAAHARNSAEAEAFIGALVPLAARLLPRVAPTLLRTAPSLIRGVANVTRALRATPTTRPLVRAVPTIVRRTAADIGRQEGRAGRPVTTDQAVRTLARQTRQVLCSPQQTAAALRRNEQADRRYHRAASTSPYIAE